MCGGEGRRGKGGTCDLVTLRPDTVFEYSL